MPLAYSLEDLAWQEKEIIEKLKAELAQALNSNDELKDNAERIEEILSRLKKLLFAKRSERSDRAENRGSSGSGGSKGPRSPSQKLPSRRYPNVEVVEVEEFPEHEPLCMCCGNVRVDSGLREVTEQLTVIPRRFQILRISKPKYHCCRCQSGLVVYSSPRIKQGSSFSDAMIIDVAAAKYGDLVPIERYCELASAEGLDGLPSHSLIELTHHLADFLSDVVELIRKSLLAAEVLCADETPHRMLEGDETSNWYLWGFCDGKNSYFEIHNTRSGDVASQLLENSSCHTLVSDVFSGYERAVRIANERRASKNKIRNAFCNTHARRRFDEALDNFPTEAAFYLEKYREIYRIEKETKCHSFEERLLARQSKAPIFQSMLEQCKKNLFEVSRKSSLARALKYFDENFNGLTLCLTDPNIPLDNNLQERQIRRPVIGRKTWYGTHSKRGAETAAALFTVSQSCRLNNVNLREYLHAVTNVSDLVNPTVIAQSHRL